MSDNISDNFERMSRLNDEKRASKRKTRSGIKAVITLGDLQSVVDAAKHWQDKLVAEGVDASKLLHHIANAEQVLVKYRNRSKSIHNRRVRLREDEAMAAEVQPTIQNQEPTPPPQSKTPELGRRAWNVLSALGFPSKEVEEKSAEAEKGAARPTRW